MDGRLVRSDEGILCKSVKLPVQLEDGGSDSSLRRRVDPWLQQEGLGSRVEEFYIFTVYRVGQ